MHQCSLVGGRHRYVGNAWRTGGDIGAQFEHVFSDLAVNNAWASIGGLGGWNDADMVRSARFSPQSGGVLAVRHSVLAACWSCMCLRSSRWATRA